MPLFNGQTKVSTPIKRPTRMVRGLFVVFLAFSLFVGVGAVGAAFKVVNPPLFNKMTGNLFVSEVEQREDNAKLAQGPGRSKVLGESIVNPLLQFNVPATFTALLNAASLKVGGETELTGPVIAGSTLQVSDTATFDEDVIIEGTLLLGQGFKAPGATIDVGEGKVLGSNLLYKVTAGDGITTSGTQELTIANSDKGSDQKIFKTIKVGDETVSAGSNTDTLTLAAGNGVAVGIDTSNKKVTISAVGVDNSAAIGDRSYTGANYLTSNQTLTASLLALDTAIAAAGGHDALTLAGSYDYLTLSSQQLTLGQIDLTTDVTGVLPITTGGTGASSLSNLITLATHTTGNYVATIADAGSSLISVLGSGSENAAITLSIVADALDFTQLDDTLELDASTDIALDGSEVFSLTNTGSGSSLLVNDEASDTTPFRISADGNVGIGVTASPGQKVHIGDGNLLFEGGGETAMIFKRGVTYTGGASGTSANPIFQMGRIVQAGDGDPEIRFMYSDDSAAERVILEFDRKGIVSSVKTDVGSFFEGHISGDTHPYFRLNSYPNMRLEMGPGGSGDTDVAIARTGTNTLGLITNGSTRLTVDSNGNVGIGTSTPIGVLHVNGGPVGKALVTLNQTGNQDILTASASGTTKLTINNSGNFALPNRAFEFVSDWVDSSAPDMFTIRRTASTFNSGSSNMFVIKDTSKTWFSVGYSGMVISDGQGATGITSTGGVSWETGGDFVLTSSSGWEAFRAVAAGSGTGHRTLLRGSTSGFDLTTVSGSSTGVRSLAGASTLVGFTVMGASSQTANLQEWQNSSASPLSVINSAGNLGIGTSAPVSMLHVTGGSVGKALAIFNQTGDQAILTASASGTTKFIVANDGNVGIGTAAPSAALEVDGQIKAGNSGYVFSTQPNMGFYTDGSALFYIKVGGTDIARVDGNSFRMINNVPFGWAATNSGNADLKLYRDAANILAQRNSTSAQEMRIYNSDSTADEFASIGFINNSNVFAIETEQAGGGTVRPIALLGGNVGIGSTSPAGKLDVTDTSNTAASLTLTNNTATTIGAGANTMGVIDLQSTSLTTGNFLNLEANALTSGKGINLTSTSTALSTGSLTNLYWNPASATTATGDLFKIDIGANGLLTGNLFALYNNASSIFRVGTAQINSDVPHSFNAAGDVSVAYDLVFTNQTSSNITSLGPLTLSSGEAFENNDLNLVAYGTGKINLINSGLGLQTSEKLIFDTDDSNDSYLAHSNSGNYLSIFADNTEAARFKSDGAVDGNTTFNANAFDLAEYYPTKDTTVEAGDVVSIAPKSESDTAATDSPYLVEKSSKESVGQVIGVVSTKPGFALGGGSFRSEMCTEVMHGGEDAVRQKLIERELGILSSDTTTTASGSATKSASTSAQLVSSSSASNSSTLKYSKDDLSDAQLTTIEDKIQTCKAISSVPIALAGRVPVKVDPAVAKEIKAGDLLTASTTKAGTAKKATEAGWVLGRALEDYKEGNDTVMTFVFVTYYSGGSTNSVANIKPNGSPVVLSDEVGDVLGMMADSSNNVYLVSYASLNVTGDVAAANLTASSQIIAGNLTIDSTDNSITSIADSILKLQTDVNAGAVDIFNGKIIFNTDGEIITLSDLQAKMIGAEKFMIKRTQDAAGKDTSSVGLATLKAGTKELQVSNPNVTISSKIFVTPRSSTRGQALFVSAVEQEKFTVSIDTALTSDLVFDYWILGVQ